MVLQEKAFPRGPLKKVKRQDDDSAKNSDVKKKDKDLFSVNDKPKVNKKALKKKEKAKAKKAALKEDEDEGGLKVLQAEALSYNQLMEGMTLMAKVSQVRDYDMRLSLPGRLIGSVPIANVNAHYTKALQELAQGGGGGDSEVLPLQQMFAPGQTVVAAVTDVDAKDDGFHRVTLTLDPKEIYGSALKKEDVASAAADSNFRFQAAVQSVEDHGYVMDLGIKGLRAFLPKKKATQLIKAQDGRDQLGVGQPVSCVVVKADSVNLTLSAEPQKITHCLVKDAKALTVHSMLPGTKIKAKVSDGGVKQGIKVNLPNTDLVGYVHRDHFPSVDPDSAAPESGSEVEASVLYVLPTVNTVYLSLRPDVGLGADLALPDPFGSYKVGDLVEECEVVRSARNGILLRFPAKIKKEEDEEKEEDNFGFVSLRNLSEGKDTVQDVRAEFPLGAKKSCRVFQYDYMDGLFICSMQKTMLKQSVLKIDHLTPGEAVTAVIKRVEGRKGLLVEMGKNMEAFVPALHMSDVPLKNPEKKFTVGDRIKCRVLRVDPTKRKVHLTAKSILVNEEFPVVSTYDPDDVGKVTEGVVVSLSTEGILLQLFGEARGWVPKRFISAEGPVEYPEKLFFIGQSLKCKVIDVTPEKSQMTLSLIIGGTSKPLGSKEKKSGMKLTLGATYQCQVMDVAADGLAVEVKVNEDEVVKAHIPTQHLTDHPAMAEQLLATYSVGETVEALCFEKDFVPIMTLKPFILEASSGDDCQNKSFEDLNEGQVLPGVVCLVKKYGVFLKLPAYKFRKSALIPTRNLADFFVEDPQEYVANHETVFAKIVEKSGDQKLAMSSKLQDVLNSGANHTVHLMESLLTDMAKIARKSPMPQKVGTVATGTVVDVSDFGVQALLPGNVRALVPRSSLAGLPEEPVVGGTLSGVVVFLEHQFMVVELSPNPDLVKRVKMRKEKHLPKEGQAVRGNVVLVRSELGFVVLCVKSPAQFAGHLVYVPTRQHINDKVGFADAIAENSDENSSQSVIIKATVGEGHLIGVLEDQEAVSQGKAATIRKLKRRRVDSVGSDGGGGERSRLDSTASATDEDVKDTSITSQPPRPPPAKKAKKGRDINLSVLQSLCPPGVKVEVKSEQETEQEKEVKVVSEKTSEEKKRKKKATAAPPAAAAANWENDEDFNPWKSVSVKEGPDSDVDTKKEDEEAEDGATSAGGKKKKHLSKKEAKALSKLEDAEIERVESEVISGSAANAEPQTVQDFDKLVLGSPDSSLCWIKYMAHHLSKQDATNARKVAKRALEKINFRLENERLNVYMAWFNLENSFGTAEDADACLKEALKCNDSYKVYAQAASVYEAQGPDKLAQAEKLYKTMARKFSKEPEAWALLGKHFFAAKKDLKEARFTLQRALQNLDKKNHVELSSRFGVLEFKHGESERGKSIFENIISNFPRRLDQWNVYIDMVTKVSKEVGFARELYDRMVCLNLPPKKMKAIFKRYMDFETTYGDQQSVDKVRKKALEYVESKFGSSSQEEKGHKGQKAEDDDEDMQDPMDQLMDMDD